MDNEDTIFDIHELNLRSDFDSQVQQISRFIRLSKSEVEHLQLLFNDLQNILQTAWPGCKVKAFGSIVTGLGLKSSNVDCYISLPTRLPNPGDNYVVKAKATLAKWPEKFRETTIIYAANVSVVKFYHVPTKRYCEINFKSKICIENSKLLSYLLTMDNRAIFLAIIIKYWAKVNKVIERNCMSNYALILLIIFYLQVKGILPSIYHLQKNVYNMEDCWNVGFEKNMHSSENNESLYQLLGGFFKYYYEFNYTNFIVCPYLGRPIKRESFRIIENVPPEYKLYIINVKWQICQPLKLNNAICLQDPFEHNINCTPSVYPRSLHKIKSVMKLSAQSFISEESEIFLTSILPIGVTQNPVVSNFLKFDLERLKDSDGDVIVGKK